MTVAAHDRERGLTLIELLVCLAVLSVTATMLLAGTVGAGTVARRTHQAGEAVGEVAAAQTILRDRIGGLRPVARLNTRDATMDVSGTDRRFDFYAVPPAGDPEGGVQKYRLLLTGAGDLVLFRAPELSDRFDVAASDVLGWKASRLISGVSSLSIGYYGALRTQRERTWRSFWFDSATAPELVRIRVAFAEGDPRVWPDLVVRPATTVDLSCDPEKPGQSCGAPS